jgi:hypothetical protein
MKRQSFRSWLFRQHKRPGPVGDLARDFRADYRAHYPDESPLPRRFTFRTALDYLEGRNACDGALDALRTAHQEYRHVILRFNDIKNR